MTRSDPTPEQLRHLWAVVATWIDVYAVYEESAIYQRDDVSTAALGLAADVADIVGYAHLEDT